MHEVERLRKAVLPCGRKLDALARAADREHVEPPRRRSGDHRARMRIVGIDHRRAARRHQVGEQPQLGGEIIFERRMIVEMIAADIGEGADLHAQAVEPMLIEPMRRGFDGEMRDALARKRLDVLMQRDRIGRRQRAVLFALRA